MEGCQFRPDVSSPASCGESPASTSQSFASTSTTDLSRTHPVLSMSYDSPPQSWPMPPTEQAFTFAPLGSVLEGADEKSETFGRRSYQVMHDIASPRGPPPQMSVLSAALAGPQSPTQLAVQMSTNDLEMEDDGWSSSSESGELEDGMAGLLAQRGYGDGNDPFNRSWSDSGGDRDGSFRKASPDRRKVWEERLGAAECRHGRAAMNELGSPLRSGLAVRSGAMVALPPGGGERPFALDGAGEPSFTSHGGLEPPHRSFRAVATAQRSAVLSTLRDLPDGGSRRLPNV